MNHYTVALNISPEVVLQRNLLHTYKRSGSNYIELENHSNSLQNMNGFATPMVIVAGRSYNYIVQTTGLLIVTGRSYNYIVQTTGLH